MILQRKKKKRKPCCRTPFRCKKEKKPFSTVVFDVDLIVSIYNASWLYWNKGNSTKRRKKRNNTCYHSRRQVTSSNSERMQRLHQIRQAWHVWDLRRILVYSLVSNVKLWHMKNTKLRNRSWINTHFNVKLGLCSLLALRRTKITRAKLHSKLLFLN